MNISMKDKVVLVTGGSTGIGAATAKAFAANGAKVAINYARSTDAAQAVCDEIKAAGGVADLFQADVSQSSQARDVVDAVVRRFGQLDVLICNAGGLVDRKGLLDLTDEFYDQVLDLNVRSVVASCAAAIPHLEKTRGNVIVTGSVASQIGGGAGASLYAASKAAVQNLVKTYSKEFAGKGIRFNSVSPGTIYTLFHERHTKPEVLDMITKSIPMGRLGKPEDCAGAYLFLASHDLAGYITGQTIEVNGGQFMA
ncbi:SDR family NAD(P)-dependent oxidoreductase [Stappia sp.]|uniref:SDR family NAD(P)-dependent oxidoreductase n=1 Tax=Stappia sp. TaxID=1870903 RepID=UPI003A99F6A4